MSSNFTRRRLAMRRYEKTAFLVLLLIVLLLFTARLFPVLPEKEIQVEIKRNPLTDTPVKSRFKQSGKAEWQSRQKKKIFTQSMPILQVNNMSIAEWQSLGFSPAQATTIVHFRNSMKGFHSEKELRKCFVISEGFMQQFKDKINFSSNNEVAGIKEKKQATAELPFRSTKSEKELVLLELNSADTSSLRMLKGIGPYWAYRIFNYRRRLGGFLHPGQLLEIEGMDSSLYNTILPSLLTDTLFVDKIPINRVSAHRLQQHPYFKRNLAVALVNYRERHGPYKSPDELRKCLLVDPHIFRKIVPYLTFSD